MVLDRQTSKKHLILKPKEASPWDLFRILFFAGHVEKSVSIECVRVKPKIVNQRVIIFISVIAQKALQSVAVPLSRLGSELETWLNLLSSNTNLCSLLLNLIRARDRRYYAVLCAMASKLSYENEAFTKATVEDRWKFQGRDTTQALMLCDENVDPKIIVVAFRGSEPFSMDAWCTDCDISWLKFKGIGKVHGGFMKALGLQKNYRWPLKAEQNNHRLAYFFIREQLREIFQKNKEAKFLLTGHSMGGALAVLFPAVLAIHNEVEILERLEAVYTFGQPRVGDQKFGRFMKELFSKYGVKYYRFVYSYDIVPRLPYDNSTLMFKHFGTCLYFNSVFEGKRIDEVPDKNYFSLRSFFSKRLTAAWELLRSFIIPYTNGPEYRESSLLKVFRVFGLVFPGLSAHTLQDYVNATRLASADLYSLDQECM
ncbi:Triacylglycerol lipase [Bertholletia excelsa]